MKKWRCTVCGYIHEGDTPPEICPVCGAGSEFFKLVNPEDEKKIPVYDEHEPDGDLQVGIRDPKAMQSALFKISYGLFIVTSVKQNQLNGQCANTVFQITSDPMRIALGINKSNLTHEFIEYSGVVGVTILGEKNHDLVRHFGYISGRNKDKLQEMEYITGFTGVPLLKKGVAFLEAKVIPEKSTDVGTHTLFVADILDGAVIKDTEPMTYTYYRKTK